MRCQKRQDFLGAPHNMSPSLIIPHSQTWFALNALMLKEPHRLEASQRWNRSAHPWQTAIHHARIKQSCISHPPPPHPPATTQKKKADITHKTLKYIQQNFKLGVLIPTFWNMLSNFPSLKYWKKGECYQREGGRDRILGICHIY